MGLETMRGGGRCPPFLVAGLVLVSLVIAFNWWSVGVQNEELLRQLDQLGEQLKICSEEQETCLHQRQSAEGRVKGLDAEVAALRVRDEQARADADLAQAQLTELRSQLAAQGKAQARETEAASLCVSELESLKKLDAGKDASISALRLEAERLRTQHDEDKRAAAKMVEKLHDAELARSVMRIPTPKETVAVGSPAEISNHEQARDADKAELEENNAGERGDEIPVEEAPIPEERMDENTGDKNAIDLLANRV